MVHKHVHTCTHHVALFCWICDCVEAEETNIGARRLQESHFHSEAMALERRLDVAGSMENACLMAEFQVTVFSSLFAGLSDPNLRMKLAFGKHEMVGDFEASLLGHSGPRAKVHLSAPMEILFDPDSPKLKERVVRIDASLRQFTQINKILKAFPGVFLREGQQPSLNKINLGMEMSPVSLRKSVAGPAGAGTQATLSVQMSICGDEVDLELATTKPSEKKGWLDIALKLAPAIFPNVMRCLFPEDDKTLHLRRLDEQAIFQSAVKLSEAGVEPENMDQLIWLDPNPERRLAGSTMQTMSQSLVEGSRKFLVFFKEVNDENGQAQKFLKSIGLHGVRFRPLIKPEDPAFGVEVYIKDADLLDVGGFVGEALSQWFDIFRVRACGWVAVGAGDFR